MAQTEIWNLDIGPVAEDHIWRHRIIPEQLYAILSGPYLDTGNRPERTATHRLIGRDMQGQCICAPIAETNDPHVWRVITAWYCKKGEAALLRRVE
jgi:hypothetical protein